MPRASLAVPLCVAALLLAACAEPDTEPSGPSGSRTTAPPSLAPGVAPDPLVWLGAGPAADDGAPARQLGSARTRVAVAALSGGAVEVAPSDDPGVDGDVLRFPAYTAEADYPRAALTVTPVDDDSDEDDNPLDPGTDDVTFGADLVLDEVSADRADDNGNNVLQRGISSYPSLFKLEVDADDRPACTVRGDAGTLVVRSQATVLPGTWYRVACTRAGDRLEVAVGEVLADGSAVLTRRDTSGPVGSIVQADPRVPLSVGGKVDAEGRMIRSASDQFNGSLANPYLRIDR